MIKFLVTTAAIIFFGLAGAQYAKADEVKCEITKEQAHETMSKIEGVVVRDLTKTEVAKVVDKKGAPPNAKSPEALEMELVSKDDERMRIRAINVYENGCFINRLGPTSPEAIAKLLDEVEA